VFVLPRHRYRLPGRERAARVGRGRRVRGRPPGPDAGHAGRRQRHDGRAVAAGGAAGRAVPRGLLPEQRVVPVRRGHRAAGRGGHAGPRAGPVRVARRRPVVLPVHERRGRRPAAPLGRLRGRVRGRRGGRVRPAADGRGRARRDARARAVRLRALFVLPAGHGGRAAAGRARADRVHRRRTRARDQRVRRPASGPDARLRRQTHARPWVRVTRGDCVAWGSNTPHHLYAGNQPVLRTAATVL